MRGLLQQWGCEVVVAHDGDGALVAARNASPDVVLCDLRLADQESGIDVVARLQREGRWTLACAFITGESTPERMRAAQATGYLLASKPLTPARLRAIVERVLSDRAARAGAVQSTS
jgi:DNA-binding NtrC family response regulator